MARLPRPAQRFFPTLFRDTLSVGAKLVIFAAASAALMVADHRGRLEAPRIAISSLAHPLHFVASLPVAWFHRASAALAARERLLEENEKLRRERLFLNARAQRFAALQEENRRLKNLLESSTDILEGQVLMAELVQVNLQPFRQQIIINKGRRDEVFKGQPVVDADGVMGQVTQVGLFSSTVLLLTDPAHSIPVQIDRNGLRSIAVGAGRDNALLLDYLPANADVKEGDLIVSSGLGGRFPPGYPVGSVTQVAHALGEPFSEVSVAPRARFGRSREVLLLWPDAEQRGQSAAGG